MAAAAAAAMAKGQKKAEEDAKKDRERDEKKRQRRDKQEQQLQNDQGPPESKGPLKRVSMRLQELEQGAQDKWNRGPKLPCQDRMLELYNNPKCQMFVALLIVANFFTTIAEKEIDPPFGEKYPEIWKGFEDAFNVIFLLELILNMWGSFPFLFWHSGWNIFDFIVVSVGCLSLLRVDLPGELSLLRTLRAFRVFRLFKRVKSLNKIINSIAKAVPGVANAFLIMVILMCIYAIIAVEWFATFGTQGSYTTYALYGNESFQIEAKTGRGLWYGDEYYGTFSRALYTLWQVLTGESWSEAIARPLMFGYETPARASGLKVGIFFTSFLIVTQIVMVNVVVAVLLEKMVEDEPAEGRRGDDSDDESAEEDDYRDSAENGNSQGAHPEIDDKDDKMAEDTNSIPPLEQSADDMNGSGSSSSGKVLGEIVALKRTVDHLYKRLDSVNELQDRLDGMQMLLQQLLIRSGTAAPCSPSHDNPRSPPRSQPQTPRVTDNL
eukprot:TRINITY_DN42391_c0_g1_i1.p1 TRINITY_DN42391_c0_g1~~TRINITY_DN42391_c0_g1_i1.p1  ORF type:complete len:493 (+),score=93.05 TRINITY_DN42391_c0_g1_i1:111-1589(+)